MFKNPFVTSFYLASTTGGESQTPFIHDTALACKSHRFMWHGGLRAIRWKSFLVALIFVPRHVAGSRSGRSSFWLGSRSQVDSAPSASAHPRSHGARPEEALKAHVRTVALDARQVRGSMGADAVRWAPQVAGVPASLRHASRALEVRAGIPRATTLCACRSSRTIC